MEYKEFNKLILPEFNTKYGAKMGRSNVNNVVNEIPKTTTRRVYLDNGGYDRGGVYWGLGKRLYVTYSKCKLIITFFRES